MNGSERLFVIIFISVFICSVCICCVDCKASECSKTPCRVVSMAPHITETIFALGCGGRIVGVTDFCVYPKEVMGLPKLGGTINPNLERLASLRPDLVVVQGKNERLMRFCNKRRVPVLNLEMENIESIYDGIGRLGRALNCPQNANTLCGSIRKGLEEVRESVAGLPRKEVFLCFGRISEDFTNIFTVGGGSFISEILHIAGGRNIFSRIDQRYPEISKESIIKKAPEIIIEIRAGEDLSNCEKEAISKEWKRLASLKAASQGRVYVFTENFLLMPGPRVVEAARLLAEEIHQGAQDGR